MPKAQRNQKSKCTHPQILVKRFDKNAPIPSRQREGDVGIDLTSCEDLVLEAGQIKAVLAGVGFGFPTGVYGQTFSRSSMAVKGLTVIPGVVDTGYTGVVMAMMHNISTSRFTIKIGNRIAQIVPIIVSMAPLVLVDELPQTERGDMGFGSTGTGQADPISDKAQSAETRLFNARQRIAVLEYEIGVEREIADDIDAGFYEEEYWAEKEQEKIDAEMEQKKIDAKKEQEEID